MLHANNEPQTPSQKYFGHVCGSVGQSTSQTDHPTPKK